MKAAYIEKFGGPEVLQYGDLPDPMAGPGEVVVDVHAATVNAADWKFRAGEYARHANMKFPQVPGRDFSGVVSAVGAGADLKVGDAVFGVLAAGKEGTYCEKIAIAANLVAKKPDSLSHINAAALALAGLTAINSLEDTLHLKRGEKILIQGGAGGVAGFAIQFAKHLGATVVTTTSAGNMAYVKSLGADEVIDYNAQNFTRTVAGCDAVFETVGGDVAKQSYAVLKPGGRAAFIASGAEAPKPDRTDVTGLRPPVPRSRKAMERIAEFWTAGAIKPPEVKLYKLAQAAEAHRMSQGRHFRGKLVFQVR
ncbi:MAG TPA: NADP-dependent oxidoreductase [Xanthobacteraceae bacterium]|nr:NADP-dependent oxidoreductase [Xanthobacteraceae bacterium]